MNRAKKLLTGAAGMLDLPADIVAGLPKMELTGFVEFSLEPHKGLLEYADQEIILDSSVGQICIRGENLSIKLMNRARITVTGNLTSVELLGGGGHA
ncbi:MAG: YabP/YqfC family sporulation protein [Candidatus Avoscillospira sp.]